MLELLPGFIFFFCFCFFLNKILHFVDFVHVADVVVAVVVVAWTAVVTVSYLLLSKHFEYTYTET